MIDSSLRHGPERSRGSRHPGRLRMACRSLWRAGVEFLYPQTCPGCGGEVDDACRGAAGSLYPAFCRECRTALAVRIEHSCIRCGAAVGPFLDTNDGCIHCRRDRFAFDTVIRLGIYKDALRLACLKSKRRDGGAISAGLAGLLWHRERNAFDRFRFDLVTSVPMHWTNRLFRSHNPSLTMAQVLARCLQVEWGAHILLKVRRTAAQSTLPPGKRRTNLKRAFHANRAAAIEGRSILLVDDILTTGTTAHEASKALKRKGAARVVVAVVARAMG